MRAWILPLAVSLQIGCERGEGPGNMKGEQGASARTALLTEGALAPEFVVTAHTGEEIRLSALRGKNVVLYFYPKDDTPGCTIEAQEIRDDWAQFQSANTVVLGVSADDNESHAQFARKHKLPFALLPDPDHEIARAYGVPVRLGFTKRVTYVIDRQGKIAKVFDDVNPNGHAAELAKVVGAL
jgi:thioredoxin-dependent peroxiredoxin